MISSCSSSTSNRPSFNGRAVQFNILALTPREVLKIICSRRICTRAPAFGGYDGGQRDVCLYLTVVSAALMSLQLVFDFVWIWLERADLKRKSSAVQETLFTRSTESNPQVSTCQCSECHGLLRSCGLCGDNRNIAVMLIAPRQPIV